VERLSLMLITAFVLAAAATPFFRRVAATFGLVDMPSPRKVHARPMPLMGGVAIYVAFLVALLLFGDRFYVRQMVGILVGATVCSLTGLWDDRKGLGAGVKLLAQLLAVAILLFADVRVRVVRIPALDALLTSLWVVAITNAMNLLDNMDGLSGGVGAVAAAFFLVLAAMSGQYLVGALSAALLGACIGFLLYNANPASIFMGDSGSLFLGFLLAATAIKLRFPANVVQVTWMIPVLVLGVPLFDTTLVVLSRLRRGANPLTAAGKDHTSHRLVRMGYTQREAVLMLYLAGCALGVLAIYVSQASLVEAWFVAGLVGLFAVAALVWFIGQEALQPGGET
jgi:UDP-GlcNAc:undecaprenyl-phosphate/decaprenyl-phosphate GlcNAc-1-phosphate transferase